MAHHAPDILSHRHGLRYDTAYLYKFLVGTASSCATTAVPLRLFQEQHQVRVRLFMQTSAVPSALYMAHARVPQHHRTKLTETMVFWQLSESGRRLLARLHFPGFVPASDADYDVVRAYWKEMMPTCSRNFP